MATRIKWMKLRRAAERVLADNGIAGKKVTLNCTTDLAEEFRSLVEWNKRKTAVNVYMNFLYNKEISDIVATLAHELAHVILDESSNVGHTSKAAAAFNEIRERLENEITKFYEEA